MENTSLSIYRHKIIIEFIHLFFGQILGYYYEPGKLFPVNDLAVLNIRGLFPKNERLITFLQTEYGKIAVIKVGASNVGKIRVTYDNKNCDKQLDSFFQKNTITKTYRS
jgi:phosphatidylserine decarboxylase